jgi:hypothetical protein
MFAMHWKPVSIIDWLAWAAAQQQPCIAVAALSAELSAFL